MGPCVLCATVDFDDPVRISVTTTIGKRQEDRPKEMPEHPAMKEDAQMPENVEQQFEEIFGQAPRFLVRAPGRVNLIGEHTDYSDLPVLPIAIDRQLLIAAGPCDDHEVVAASVAFPEVARFSLDELAAGHVDESQGWHRYLLGALSSIDAGLRPSGVRLLVGGDLPSVGGLSSSSALTLGLIAAMESVWGSGRDLSALVEAAIVAERYVGVESGGMDQNVIAHAEEGKALRIDFAPTRCSSVSLPPDARWIAASSGVEAPKGGRVRRHYNERVLGTRLAAALLAKGFGREVATGTGLKLKNFANAAGRRAVRELPAETSASDVARETGCSVDELTRASRDSFDANAAVLVRAVARHVLDEANRVDMAEEVLAASDLESMGQLLDSSHKSLADFGATTPELDAACSALKSGGALGARLTGAGFGGFAIGLCTAETCEQALATALRATGGPAFLVRPSGGLFVEER